MCRNEGVGNVDLPIDNIELTDLFTIKPIRKMMKLLR